MGVRHSQPLSSYEYGSEYTQTYDWETQSDRAYYEFLKKFGQIDFGLIGYVPEIDLAEEVEKVQAQLQLGEIALRSRRCASASLRTPVQAMGECYGRMPWTSSMGKCHGLMVWTTPMGNSHG